MSVHGDWLETLPDPAQRAKLAAIFDWIAAEFPQLGTVVKWRQPMFTDHGTFVIGFSTAKNNLAFTPEAAVLSRLVPEIEAAGYTHTDNLVRIGWDQDVDYDLLRRAIETQITEKAGLTTFWRA